MAGARSDALYASLFTLAPDAYLVTDRAGIVLEANEAAGRLLHRRCEALPGEPLERLIAEPARRDLRDLLSSLDDGAVHATELAPAPDDAEPVYLRATAAALTIDGETVIAVTLRDVTQEVERERRLGSLAADLAARVAERTRALAAVLDHLPVGVVLVDADTLNVVEQNARARDLLGSGWDHLSSLRGQAIEARRPAGEEVPEAEWPAVRALRGETVIGELLHVRTPGSEEQLFEISAAPVTHADGRIVSAVVVFQDVADRERREHAIRAFVTNAAHELGTPLAGIIAAVEALQAGAKDDPEHRDRFVDHIERESGRLERLMRALLVLARAQARAEPATLEIVPLAPLVAEVAGAVAPNRGVRVETTCDADIAAVANRPLLEQALANLAGNAARFTASGVIHVSATKLNGEVEVVVTDTGPGIPDAVRERLFERFVRGAGDDGGFGLGLAIARDSIRATGGTLEVEQAEGGGTRAVVRLPGARLVGAG